MSAIMRQILVLADRRAKKARAPCCSCHKLIYAAEKFCPFCGIQSRTFDLSAFEQYALTSYDESHTLCDGTFGHRLEAVQASAFKEAHPRLDIPLFCSVCGSRLPSLDQLPPPFG